MNDRLNYFSLMGKDLTDLSDKNYNTLRRIFKQANLKQTLSPFHRVLALRKKMYKIFRTTIKQNSKGFYTIVLKRLQFVLPFIQNYYFRFLLGGDLKYLAILRGINAANSNYPRIFCVCHKSEFCNTKKEWSITDASKGARNLIDAQNLCKNQSLGYINKPLFNYIKFFEIIFDMLHSFLRITEKLKLLF